MVRLVRWLENVGVGVAPAGGAQQIALEERKALHDLGEIPAPGANPAPVADRAPLGDARSAHDVTAMAVRGEAPALAAVALRAGPDADLVHPVHLGAGGDDVAAAALVAGEDLVGVELEEAQAPQDVGFGGGWVLHLRYTLVDQERLLLVRAPASVQPLPESFCVYAPYYIGTGRRKSRKNLQYSLDFEEIIP